MATNGRIYCFFCDARLRGPEQWDVLVHPGDARDLIHACRNEARCYARMSCDPVTGRPAASRWRSLDAKLAEAAWQIRVSAIERDVAAGARRHDEPPVETVETVVERDDGHSFVGKNRGDAAEIAERSTRG